MCGPVGGTEVKASGLELRVPLVFPPPGDGNEAIGTLIHSYIREIEELR